MDLVQVLEFVEFKERLERSHALAVARSEQVLVEIRRAVPQGFACIQAALREACQILTQGSLLTQHSGALSLEQLRFNEDLSTRPAWLPPQAGPMGAALLGWWEQHSTAADAGMVSSTSA